MAAGPKTCQACCLKRIVATAVVLALPGFKSVQAFHATAVVHCTSTATPYWRPASRINALQPTIPSPPFAWRDSAVHAQRSTGNDVAGPLRMDIFEAVLANDEQAVLQYIDNGGDVQIQDAIGDTPLMLATENHLINIIELLIRDGGAEVNRRSDNGGETPLHLAAYYGYTDLVAFLVERCGADLDLTTYGGDTPLHLAAFWGNAATVRYLLEAGANPMLFNRGGMAAGDVFEEQFSGDDDTRQDIRLMLQAARQEGLRRQSGLG